MSPDDLQSLNDQLAAMARSGLPLEQGLDSMSEDLGSSRLSRLTAKIAADLKAGVPLDKALKNRSRSMPHYYPALVTAGIRTGRLPQVLASLGHYSKSMSLLRFTIIDALIYPLIVLFVAFILIGALTFLVLPEFDKMYAEYGMTLPWITRVILNYGQIPVFIMGLILFMTAMSLLLMYLTRTMPDARRTGAQLLYQVPLIGTIARSSRLAAFTELLALLIDFEVPLPEAFRAAGEASPDPIMGSQAERIADTLDGGATLAQAITGRGLIPQWMAWMTERGEKQSRLGETLHQVAQVYRRSVEARLAVLRHVLPSFIIVFTAGIITICFAIAVMAPMGKLLEGLSK